MTSIDPAALQRLVRDHDVDPDYDMQQALDDAGVWYSMLLGIPNQGAQKKQLSKLAKKGHQLVNAINEFEGSLSGFDSFPRSKADPVTLSRHDSAIQQIEDNWKIHIKKQRDMVRANAEKWATNAEHALAGIGRLKTGGECYEFNSLLNQLIDVYVDSTGKEPTKPSFYDSRGGPMFEFISDCLDILGIDKKTNDALGSAIDRILKKRKQ